MFQEILENIWFITNNNKGQYPYSNSLFINDQKKLLIDTGVGKLVLKKCIEKFEAPDIILYSHGHEDHISAEKLFPMAEKYIHPKDKLMATSKEELLRIYGISENIELLKFIDSYFKTFHYNPLTQVNTFSDDQIFNLGNIQVKVLYSPGHSAGHCCFEILNKSLIFSSDIDLTSFGPWYGGLDSDIYDFKSSIKLLIKKSPKILITSHKGIFQEDVIQEKLKLYLNKFKERDEEILNVLKKEKTLNELTSQALIYGKFIEPIDFFVTAERIMLEKHLTILLNTNKIEYKAKKYKVI
ncbi:MAG: MBL fold metallo-hydrolase [Promethearchaeota archaeon]